MNTSWNQIAERNINTFRYAYDTTLMAESEVELKRLLMRVKEENEKAGLKLNIQETKIMASGPNTSWQTDEEKVETREDLIFFFKITVDGGCSHDSGVICISESIGISPSNLIPACVHPSGNFHDVLCV